MSGEEVTYAHDPLKSLASAAAAAPHQPPSYTYGGWGNLTDQNVTKGSAPTMHVAVDPATNRANQGSYDANGNSTAGLSGASGELYDIDNRLIYPQGNGYGGANFMTYGYDPKNKRIYKNTISFSTQWNWYVSAEEVTFYSPSGQKLAQYTLTPAYQDRYQPGPGQQWIPATLSITATQTTTNTWFGGRLVRKNGTSVAPDRLGSIGKYYPYGQGGKPCHT